MHLQAASLLLLLLCPSHEAAPLVERNNDGKQQRLIVFGDSFSDDGHGAWVASNGTWPLPSIYYGHHFSNGPVWAQLVAGDLDLKLLDYATGGATANNSFVAGFTGPNSDIPVPSAQDQIDRFQTKYSPNPNDIFVDFIGANDAFFSTNITGTQVANLIRNQVEDLYASGARHVLLASYPNLRSLPVGPISSAAYASFLGNYSEQLRQGLFSIQADLKHKFHIQVVDLYPIFQDILRRPKAYGFDPAVVQVACAQGVYPSEGLPLSICDDPDKHLFWDIYHPTRVGHQIVAKAFMRAIKGKKMKEYFTVQDHFWNV